MRRWMNEAVSLDLAYMHAHPGRSAILASMEDLRCVGGRIVEKKVDQASALACLGAAIAYWCISTTKGMIGKNYRNARFLYLNTSIRMKKYQLTLPMYA